MNGKNVQLKQTLTAASGGNHDIEHPDTKQDWLRTSWRPLKHTPRYGRHSRNGVRQHAFAKETLEQLQTANWNMMKQQWCALSSLGFRKCDGFYRKATDQTLDVNKYWSICQQRNGTANTLDEITVAPRVTNCRLQENQHPKRTCCDRPEPERTKFKLAKCCNPYGDDVVRILWYGESVRFTGQTVRMLPKYALERFGYRIIESTLAGKSVSTQSNTLRVVGHDIGILKANITSIISKKNVSRCVLSGFQRRLFSNVDCHGDTGRRLELLSKARTVR